MAELPPLNRALVEFEHPAAARLLDLPEKVIQFGTGAFLRGFVGAFISEANRTGVFAGRIVAIASTNSGRDRAVAKQDGLYTLAVQGIERGQEVQRYELLTALSRAIPATSWQEVLECARNPELQLIFSNTTEVGITLDDGDAPDAQPPRSFPGKLTRFLYERAQAFEYDTDYGLVVIPCELIEDNGERLQSIVLQLASRWQLDRRFTRWIHDAVPFCNTLVDRIVPGELPAEQRAAAAERLGYQDQLITACEPYRLFAIEADEAARDRLAFAQGARDIIIAEDITAYRQRKVRLLNGAHTITVPLALQCGCETVAQATSDELIGTFLRQALLHELVPSLEVEGASDFAQQVLDRFANPYIRHALIDITLQQTMKMRVRVVPAILDYAQRFGMAPPAITFGFAAYLASLCKSAPRQDDQSVHLRALADRVVAESADSWLRYAVDACAATDVWGTDLNSVPGFAQAVGTGLVALHRLGARAALESQLTTLADA